MVFSRWLAVFIRNFLVKQHPYFSCCASCGEITVPLEKRLCTSLQSSFPIDIVILVEETEQAERIASCIDDLQRCLGWLRLIFVVGPRSVIAALPTRQHLRLIDQQGIIPPEAPFPSPEAHLYLLPELSEHYLIMRGPLPVSAGLLPPDFFTPNGLPKLCLEKKLGRIHERTKTLYAQTKEDASDFISAQNATEGKALEDTYFASYTHWAYTEARVIPVRFAAGGEIS